MSRIRDIMLLILRKKKWSSFMQAIDMFSDDYFEYGRKDDMEQKREEL